jgi:hypothetical protein
MYNEQTYNMAPTGWSPIRALAGAQPYEWYVTFQNFIFMYRGPTIARRAGWSPD